MKKEKKKWLLIPAILLLVASPFILLLVIGAIYCLIKSINGIDLSVSAAGFVQSVYAWSPYYPYLTIIPIILVAVPLLIRAIKKRKDKRHED